MSAFFKKFFRNGLSALLLMLLTACGDYGCVDADDWGYPKIPLLMDFEDMQKDGTLVLYPGNDYIQYMQPVDSHQLLMGTPLIIKMDRAHNQWAPFLGPWLNPMFDGDGEERMVDGWWPEKLIPNRECRYFVYDPSLNYSYIDKQFYDPNFPSNQPTIALQKQQLIKCARNKENASDFTDADFYGDCLAPCFVRHGVGLYMAIFPEKKTLDDLATLTPEDLHLTHLTDFPLNGPLNAPETGPDARAIDGFLVTGSVPGTKRNDRLYFKIEDTYYQDNTGGYIVHLKCGTKPDKKGPFQYATDMVRTFSLSMAEAMYKILTSAEGFINIVRALLVLSVVLYGLNFLMGTVPLSLGSTIRMSDFILYVLKLGAVITLISPESWDFFYNHFFKVFTSAVDFLGGLFLEGVDDLGLGCNWLGEESPWYAADVMFRVLTSDETWRKVASTLFSNVWGWLFIVTFIAAFVIFFIAAAKMLLIYCLGFISLAILIILFPIFFVLYLFGWTKDYFAKEWVSQVVANVTEIVFSVALLGFIFQLIMVMLQGTLGYRVCWKTFFEFPKTPVLVSLEFFMPDIGPVIEMTDTDGDGATDTQRYRDMPYFDLTKDADKIQRYLRGNNFIDLSGLVGLLAVMLIFRYMSDLLSKISDELKAGGDSFRQSASLASGGAWTPSAVLNDARQTLPVKRRMAFGFIPWIGLRKGGAFVDTMVRASTVGKAAIGVAMEQGKEAAKETNASFNESFFKELEGRKTKYEKALGDAMTAGTPEEQKEARKLMLANNKVLLKKGLKVAENVNARRSGDKSAIRNVTVNRDDLVYPGISDAGYITAANRFADAVNTLQDNERRGVKDLSGDVRELNDAAEKFEVANALYEKRIDNE
ncbi:MAG: type IV secretion system protein [Rickettsiales bacterium]